MVNDDLLRFYGDFEIREIGEGTEKKTHIQGYALTFETMSEDLGYREIISKGSLDGAKTDNVILVINHDKNLLMARNTKNTGVGSLTLSIDEKGLFFDAIPTDTSYSRDLITNMESGIIGKCSFAFRMDWTDKDAYTWDWDLDGKRGFDLLTIKKISEIRDVSIVTSPAYESTSADIYKRSKDEHKKEIENQKEIERLKTELELIEIENELL